MHDDRDLRIEQANAAIRSFIHTLPGGRITPADRPEYERLVGRYFDALQPSHDPQGWNPAPDTGTIAA